MNIDRQKVLELYLKVVDNISTDLEDKSSFTPEEIVSIIIDIIEELECE
jgi:hypothetical protein